MVYARFFLEILWYTLGATILCGLCVFLCRRLFIALMGSGVGRGFVMATSIVGTPVHELGHALMCLLFGHKIREFSLWQPCSEDGTLGYVTHSYNRCNPYHVLGNLFIGIGPILSGLGILTLILWLCFPETLADYLSGTRAILSGGADGSALLREGLSVIPRLVQEVAEGGSIPWWGRLIGIAVLFSVSLHMELSTEDIKGSLRAIPLYLVLTLLCTLICGLCGSGVMGNVRDALALFSAYQFALYGVILVAILLQLLPAGVVFLLRQLVRRR